MEALRISLMIVGISVLIGVYLYDSNSKLRTYLRKLQLPKLFNKNDYNESERACEPEINDENEILAHIEQLDGVVTSPYSKDAVLESKLESEPDSEPEIVELTDEISVPAGDEMVIILFIISRGEHYFTGTEINNSCSLNGFEFTDKNIYENHSTKNLKDKRAVASIVNSFEPGTFDSDFENFDTKAITLLLYLPGPDDEITAFNDIVERGKKIAKSLNAELCDETRSVLTPQTISHIEEKIEAFQFKNKMLRTSKQH